LRQNDSQYVGVIDRPDDGIGIESAGCHVPGRDPAANAAALELSANGIGYCRITLESGGAFQPLEKDVILDVVFAAFQSHRDFVAREAANGFFAWRRFIPNADNRG
jgi:hypothetical protein